MRCSGMSRPIAVLALSSPLGCGWICLWWYSIPLKAARTEVISPVIALFLLTTVCFPATVWMVGDSAYIGDLLNHTTRPSDLSSSTLWNCVTSCWPSRSVKWSGSLRLATPFVACWLGKLILLVLWVAHAD